MGKKASGKKNRNQDETSNQSETVEVLYQKMGDRWFAFSYIDNEVFVGSIHQSEIDNPEAQKVEFEETIGQS